MHKSAGIVLIVLLMSLIGCGKKTTGDESQSPSETQQQPSQSSSIETGERTPNDSLPAANRSHQSAGPNATLEGGKAASRPLHSKGATASNAVPTNPSHPAGDTTEAPSTPIMLKGAPMGGVRFEHSKHAAACESCHHAPREPKLVSTSPETCTACHTKPPQPGMKTGKQAAFHNPTATAGTCIDCHKKSAVSPTKCTQCHKKENA